MRKSWINKFLCIMLTMVMIFSSSFLLFGCTVTEYVGKFRVVFISKERDEDLSKISKKIDDMTDCIDGVSSNMLSTLVDYYGPSNTPARVKESFNLAPNYDDYVVELSQILSMMEWVMLKPITTDKGSFYILSLSNYPLYSGNVGNGVNITDIFNVDSSTGTISFNEDYVNPANKFYRISGDELMELDNNDSLATIETYEGNSWLGSHVYLHQYRHVGYYSKEDSEYDPVNKIEIFFIGDQIEGSTYRFDSIDSAEAMVNSFYSSAVCNVMYKDHRALDLISTYNPVKINSLTWKVSLVDSSRTQPQSIMLYDNYNPGSTPMFSKEQAKREYASKETISGEGNVSKLTMHLLKDYFFGADGEENSKFDESNLVYVASNKKDSKINEFLSGVTYRDLYNAIIDSTKTINGNSTYTTDSSNAPKTIYGSYDLFIRSVLYDINEINDLTSFKDNFKQIFRNKVIGIEDGTAGSYYRIYDDVINEYVVTDEILQDVSYTYDVPEYYPVVSKVYCASASDGNSTYSLNGKDLQTNADFSSMNLNSIVIYGFPTEEKSSVNDNAFEGDSASEKEFRDAYSSDSGGFETTLTLSNISLTVNISSKNALEQTYTVLLRIYRKPSNGRVSESIIECTLTRTNSNSNTYTLEQRYGGNLGCSKNIPLGGKQGLFWTNTSSDPLGDIPYCGKTKSRTSDYVKAMSNSTNLSGYGAGFYYTGVSSYDKESFVEIILPSTSETGDLIITPARITVR